MASSLSRTAAALRPFFVRQSESTSVAVALGRAPPGLDKRLVVLCDVAQDGVQLSGGERQTVAG